jgi:spermidine synthase
MNRRWIVEAVNDGLENRYRVDRLHHEETTGHQRLAIFDNAVFGRMMTLDGIAQVAERDEFIYHEMMTHVPLLAHGAAREVLIIGGGDGGILREVLRHPGVERATVVEIDTAVVDTCRRHLPMISAGSFDDPRTRLVIADGARLAAEDTGVYDVIIVDSTDPVGPAEALFTDAFYGRCRDRLAAGGIVVTQNGLPFLQADELKNTMARFRALFASSACYLATVPSYIGGPMAFGWASDDPALLAVEEETLEKRFAALGIATRHYTPAIHKAAFVLPPWIRAIAG